MFEGIVANVLNKVLGDYVANLETNQLNVGIWQGRLRSMSCDVKLHKLRLRKDALDRFDLPIDVLEADPYWPCLTLLPSLHGLPGYLGTLTLKIPWSNLKGQPMKVNIEDVYLLACPRFGTKFNEQEEIERGIAKKLKKLDEFELLNRPKISQEDDQKQATFTEQLVTKIVDNLQVTIKNIHIRYEDNVSNPEARFAVGFTLSELSAVSTNKDWDPTFLQEPSSTIHKLLKLRRLSSYWDTRTESLAGLPTNIFIEKFIQSITSTSRHAVLIPIEGTGKLIVHKKPPEGEPRRTASFEFDQLAFELSEEQYRDILLLMTQFDYSMRQRRYRKFRPPPNIRPKDDPRAVYNEIHERSQRWTEEHLVEVGQDRRDYMRLYTKKSVHGDLSDAAEDENFRHLERKLPYDMLRLFRSLCQKDIARERAIFRKRQEIEHTKRLEQQQNRDGWFGGWLRGWGTSDQTKEEEEKSAEPEPVLTDEQIQELYDAIDYNEETVNTYDLPPETVLLQANVKLNSGSIKIKLDRNGHEHVLLAAVLDHCHLGIVRRPKNMVIDISVHQFRVNDGTVDGSIYPTIIYVHSPHSNISSGPESDVDLRLEGVPAAKDGLAIAAADVVEQCVKLSNDDDAASYSSGSSVATDSEQNEFASRSHFCGLSKHEPFMHIHFEKYPLSGKSDSLLKVRAQSLNIVYHPKAIRETLNFFKPPSSTAESINALIAAASKSVRGLGNQTRAELEYVLEKHKTLNLQVDFDAPVIVVPQDITDPRSPIVVLDMGHLNIVSDLVPSEELQRIRSRDGQDLSENEMAELEGLMYDQFTVELHSTQLLVGNELPACIDVIRSGRTNPQFHVVDRIKLDFGIGLCILKNPSPHMPIFKVDGRLPSLKVYFSDKKYKAIMHTIDLVMEGIDGEDSKPAKKANVASRIQKMRERRRSAQLVRRGHTGAVSAQSFPFTAFGKGGLFGIDVDHEASLNPENSARGSDTASAAPHEAGSDEGSIDSDGDDQADETRAPAARRATLPANAQKRPRREPHRKIATVRFAVDTLIGFVHRERETSQTDLHLADITVSGLTIDVVNRPFDLFADVVIHQVTLEDCLFPDAGARVYALTSDADEADANGEVDKDLVTVHYYRTQDDHPDFDPESGSVGQRVDVDVSYIDVMVIRKTILTYYDFILRTFTDQSPSDDSADEAGIKELVSDVKNQLGIVSSSSSSSFADNDGGDASSMLPQSPEMQTQKAIDTIKVNVNLNGVGVGLCHDDGSPIASLSMAAGRVEVTVTKQVKVDAKIGSLTLMDQLGLPKLCRPPRSNLPAASAAASHEYDPRLLIYIRGDELADLQYQSYDPASSDFPSYDSFLRLRVGAAHITFAEKQCRELIFFGSQFAAMHSVFESARRAAAQQAAQLSETMTQGSQRYRVDIVMNAPVVTFPEGGRMPYEVPEGADRRHTNTITAKLGELTLTNSYHEIHEGEHQLDLNKFALVLKHIGMTSRFYFRDATDSGTFGQFIEQELEILEDVDLTMDINMLVQGRVAGILQPNTEIHSTMRPIRMRLTEEQYQFAYELVQVIGRTFGNDSRRDEPDPLAQDVELDLAILRSPRPSQAERATSEGLVMSPQSFMSAQQRPSPQFAPVSPSPGATGVFATLDFVLVQDLVELEVIEGRRVQPSQLNDASLTRVNFHNLRVKYKSLSNGESKAESEVGAVHAFDSRQNTPSKFTHLISPSAAPLRDADGHHASPIPSIVSGVPQFVCNVDLHPGQATIVTATLDSPRIILVIDHIFSLWQFVVKPFGPEGSSQRQNQDHWPSDDGLSPTPSDHRPYPRESQGQAARTSPTTGSGETELIYKLNMVNPEIVLLADSRSETSEAMILSVREVIMAQEGVFCAQIDSISISICTIGHALETSRSIVDPFSVDVTMVNDVSSDDGSDTHASVPLTDVAVHIGALTLRLGYRDISLMLRVWDEINELLSNKSKTDADDKGSKSQSSASLSQERGDWMSFDDSGSGYSRRTHHGADLNPGSTAGHALNELPEVYQKMRVSFESSRLVLIRELFDMPMYDLYVRAFHIDISDWSKLLALHSDLNLQASFFNRRNSHWEPLAEPWKFSIGWQSIPQPSGRVATKLDLISNDKLETDISYMFIVETLDYISMLNKELKSTSLTLKRGDHRPYVIHNRTGEGCHVWIDAAGDSTALEESGIDNTPVLIRDNERRPWRFEDWRQRRETLEAKTNQLGIQFDNGKWQWVRRVQVDLEGVKYYALRPDIDKVKHYLAIDVSLNPQDRVKQVVLRSPLEVVNRTTVPMELVLCDNRHQHIGPVVKLDIGERYPVPIARCYDHGILVRPDERFGFEWSTKYFRWRDFVSNSSGGLIRCNKLVARVNSERGNDKLPFYVYVNASHHASGPRRHEYPFMTITLAAPLEIENLLPYDFKFQIINQATREVWTNSLARGGVSAVHCFRPGELMIFRMLVPDAGFVKCEGSIIESSTDEFPVESHITLLDAYDRKLELNLHRADIESTGNRCFKVSVYSPYVMINKTGLEMSFGRKGFFSGQTAMAGQNAHANLPLEPDQALSRSATREGASSAAENVLDSQPGGSGGSLWKPVMFSYGTLDLRNRALVKVGNSKWSEPLSFEALGSSFVIEIPGRNSRDRIHLGVEVEPGQGRYHHTKVVTFTPRFILKNNTGFAINFRQVGRKESRTIGVDERYAFGFMDWEKAKQLSVAVASSNGIRHPWSAPFDIEKLGNAHLKLTEFVPPDSHGQHSEPWAEKTMLLRIEVMLQGACVFVVITTERHYWPYQIDNFTGVSIMFHQKSNRAVPVAEVPKTLAQVDSFSHLSLSSTANVYSQDESAALYIKKYHLNSGESLQYAWDFPTFPNKELVVLIGDRKFNVSLHEIGRREPFCYNPRATNPIFYTIRVEVVAQGPQHVLRLMPYHRPLDMGVYRHNHPTMPIDTASTLVSHPASAQPSIQPQPSAASEVTMATESLAPHPRSSEPASAREPQFIFNLCLNGGIGISLLNREVREILYITLWGITFSYHESAEDQDIQLTLRWLQIDNQTHNALFPILIYPTDLDSGPSSAAQQQQQQQQQTSTSDAQSASSVSSSSKGMFDRRVKSAADDPSSTKSRPLVYASMTRKKGQKYGVEYLKFFTILLQEVSIELDMNILLDILDLTQLDVPGWRVSGERLYDEGPISEPQESDEGRQFYFEVLHLHPVRLNISFMRSSPQDAEGAVGTNPASSFDLVAYATNVLTMAIGNVNDAPIAMNALAIENVCVSLPVLLERIQTHYTHEFLSQIYKVVGSADLLGNPVGLFSTISSGVTDVFYEPYQGFISSDPSRGIGVGLAKGAGSLFKKTVYGVTDSMYRLTGSVSKGLSVATLDKSFHSKRQLARRRHRPKHALYGVAWGAESFAKSLASGITGVIQRPIEGAEKEGVSGFIKGVGKGVVGLITKPAVGIFDMASNVSEGIRNTTTVFEEHDLDRQRLPRYVRRDKILEPYSQREALGQAWMRELADGRFAHDDYAAHLELTRSGMVVLLTYSRIILFRHHRRATLGSSSSSASSGSLSASGATVEWANEITKLYSIKLEESGIVVELRKTRDEPVNPRWFIPINERQSRRWFYSKIEEVVKTIASDNTAGIP
ncbi:Vacuolar protein sorting-associated protein 13 [Spiromyces aspiralis]|uniref:Vacuolar protein sorting-associated protein 13 n=1 Tax=Spiromyces aspiralis TaxID=68401 RepID=A0ACC1HYN7_9FUNG|nr:Vacuolar protein sorting-associated protein 13 [Spiromyces aspiralis]